MEGVDRNWVMHKVNDNSPFAKVIDGGKSDETTMPDQILDGGDSSRTSYAGLIDGGNARSSE